MTYNQTVKEIKRLYELKEQAYDEVTFIQQKNICEGHGMFRPAGPLYKVTERVPRTAEQDAIQKQIDALEATIYDEKERRYIKAKRKRYEKELVELKNRMAHIEKWLAEN